MNKSSDWEEVPAPEVAKPTQYWYRYVDAQYACVDEFECTFTGPVQVERRRYEVISTTKKGVWLHVGFGSSRRFVLREARKRFACPTEAEALDSFIARKKKQIRIYEAKLLNAKTALFKAQGMANSPCVCRNP